MRLLEKRTFNLEIEIRKGDFKEKQVFELLN